MNTVLELAIILIVILFSMVLHELAHGFTAYKLGDDTAKADGRLTLNPLKHLDPVLSLAMPLLLYLTGGVVFGGAKPVPVDSRNLRHGVWGMALVALAGPLTNFLLAFLGLLLGSAVGVIFIQNSALYYSTGLLGLAFAQFIMINLGFGIFNLIPIPPLDGSRVLYALMPDAVRRLMESIEPYGIWLVMLLVVFGSTFFSSLMGTAISAVLSAFSSFL